MNKLLSFLLVLSLIVTSSLVIYADDSETSGSDPEVPESEYVVTEQDINDQLTILASNISKLQATDATYDTTDIYLLLQQMLNYNYNNQSASILFRIYNALLQTNLNFTTLFNKIDSINSKLTNEDDTLNIYDLCGDMFEQIINNLTVSVGDNIYSITDVCILIEDRIASVQESLTTIEGMIATLNNTQSAIRTLVNTISSIASSIATNTANTITAVNNNTTAVNNLRDDYNNITWYSLSDLYLGFKRNYNDSDYITGSYNYVTYPFGYFFFNNVNLTSGNLFLFNLPVRTNSFYPDFIDNIQIVYSNSSNEYDYVPVYYYEYDYTKNFVKVCCLNSTFQFSSSRPIVFKVTFKSNYVVTSNSYNVSYLRSSSKDYYDVYQYLTNLKQNKTLSKFEQLYASDDLIAAKEEQQPYESQAIEDFTGNGSAAASTSDLGDLKSISGTLKSGLATGGSVSNALAPFNANGGFWDWFKQENYNNINNLSGSSNMLRSSPSQPEIIDFYSSNQLTLQGLLGGN